MPSARTVTSPPARRPLRLSAGCLVALVLTACGGPSTDDPADDTTGSTPATPSSEATVATGTATTAAPSSPTEQAEPDLSDFGDATSRERLLSISVDVPTDIPFVLDEYGSQRSASRAWTFEDEDGLLCTVALSLQLAPQGWGDFDYDAKKPGLAENGGTLLRSGPDPDAPGGVDASEQWAYRAPGNGEGPGAGFSVPFGFAQRSLHAGPTNASVSVSAVRGFDACDPDRLVGSFAWSGDQVTESQLEKVGG